MRICLFEDAGVQNLEPLSFTRPVFDLICGRTSLRAKIQRYTGASAVGVLIRWHLTDLFRNRNPDAAVNDLNWLHADDTLFVNGRWLPPNGRLDAMSKHGVGLIGDDVAFAFVPRGLMSACRADEISNCLARWKSALPPFPAKGIMVGFPWDLVANNPGQLQQDFLNDSTEHTTLPDGLTVQGPCESLTVAADARIEAFVLVDTTGGPVVIDREALVTSFSRLEGPCYIGPKTHVMGAKIRGGTTLGPQCRVGGEVEASIIHGHSNKYHDGFLGHAYVGEWVNLAAGTHNSDLRNDYGEVSVPMRSGRVPTGLNKVGCFIGDHTKTGLGTLINTGSNIGAFANLLPAGKLAPKYVPSFNNLWKGELQENLEIDHVLSIAEKVMSRRGVDFTEHHAALYRHLFEEERSNGVLKKPKVARSA